ncbi:MAG: hypothetical protein KKI08_25675 [Armatimonadetes bacterium]|nr:hypothetical protein [Armatimonadota bacterium]
MSEPPTMTWHATFPCKADPDLPAELRRWYVWIDGESCDERDVNSILQITVGESARDAHRAAMMAWSMLARLTSGEPPDPMLAAAIQYILDGEKRGAWGAADTLAGEALADDATRDRLARELQGATLALSEAVGLTFDRLPPKADDARRAADPDAERPILVWDDRAAAHLEKIGKAGHTAAEQTRREARDRWETVHKQLTLDGEPAWGKLWALWWEPGGSKGLCPILLRLTSVLWLDKWRDEVEGERKRRLDYYPARTSSQMDMYRRGLYAPGLAVEVDAAGRGGDILDSDGREVGRVLPGSNMGVVDSRLLARMRQHVQRARTVSFIRGCNTVVCTSYQMKAAEPDHPDTSHHRTLWFDGALEGFADAAHIRVQDARPVLDAGQMIQLPMGDGGELGGLWMWRRFGGGRYAGRGRLRIIIAPEMAPVGGHRERLVPVLPPGREPALPKAGSLQGPALIAVDYTLQWLRDNAIALLDPPGYVPWHERVWLDIMARVDPGYGRREREAILGPLRAGDDSRPALLKFDGDDAVTINAEAYADVLEFLREGGRRSWKWRRRARRKNR